MSDSAHRFDVRPRPRVRNVKLITLRINAGLSPNQLGARVGVSGRAIRDAEAGTVPSPRTQFAIASAFDLSPTDLWPLELQKAMARS